MKSRLYIVLSLVILATAGCDRAFVEPDRAQIEVVSPSLTTILPNASATFAVDVEAELGVERVEVNGDTLSFDPAQELWVIDYSLNPGLNELVFVITDTENNVTRDTLYAMRSELSVDRDTPPLPEPRGGHTATLLGAHQIVFIGGARSATSDAVGTALYWSIAQSQFHTIEDRMVVPRTGHTASLLPDGRILILGGSRREPASNVVDLVETVEVFNPLSGTFSEVPSLGDAIRRAYHTASVHVLDGQTFIDLYGGQGDLSYGPQPTLGTRRDLRRFAFRNDTLFAVSPAPGPMLDFPIWGHTQTPLAAYDFADDKRFLIAGTNDTGNDAENVSFILDYTSPTGLGQHVTGELTEARVRHASVPLRSGFVATFGGYQNSPGNPINDAEIYSETADRYFIFPPSNILLRRYGLSATKFPDGRILLVGGYFSAGQGTGTTSVVRIPAL